MKTKKHLNEAFKTNKSKCISLVDENKERFTDEYKLVIIEDYIAIKGGKRYDYVSYSDEDCIEKVEKFIKDFLI